MITVRSPKSMTLSGNNHKAIRLVLFGTMCFLTLLCIVAVVKNDIFRDRYLCLVTVSLVLGLIFLTMLSGYLLLKTEEPVRPMRYFMLFLLNVYSATFFFALSCSFYRIPGYARQFTILCTLSYCFGMSVYLTLWLYQKQFLEKSVMTCLITVLISAAVAIYTALLILNLSRPILFRVTEQGVFSDRVTDYISVIISVFCLLLLFIAAFSSNLSRNRKFSSLCCVFLPALSGTLSLNQDVLSWSIYLWGILSLIVVLPLCLIFFYTYDELENDVLKHEKELTRLRISAMISQMQPHFLSNSLAVIAALCEEDPKLAAEATNAFSDYLRENMDFADKSNPISFSEELNHIQTYVWLEKLRFPNKLNVEYEISSTAFPVPALSVQPMVENAIKHGICKSKAGGTVRISSFESSLFYCVTVSDDGTGFDVRKTIDDSKRHLGINNTRYRIREMMGGSLEIVSTPGEGTTVTIRIPK